MLTRAFSVLNAGFYPTLHRSLSQILIKWPCFLIRRVPCVKQWLQRDAALKAFTIIGYMFVLLNEVRHTLGLPQCLFHTPHIVPRMITAIKECHERVNQLSSALISVLVLDYRRSQPPPKYRSINYYRKQEFANALPQSR